MRKDQLLNKNSTGMSWCFWKSWLVNSCCSLRIDCGGGMGGTGGIWGGMKYVLGSLLFQLEFDSWVLNGSPDGGNRILGLADWKRCCWLLLLLYDGVEIPIRDGSSFELALLKCG